MANDKTNNENEKLPMQTRVDPSLYNVILNFADTEERSLSNTIERLLRTHPRIQPILEEAAAAGAV